MSRIRNLAICVFHRDDRILVAKGHDDVKDEFFYRPLGGEIEFGESAEDALRREILEELGLSLMSPVLLGVLENQFVYRGRAGHEIVFVFDATFADPRVYAEAMVPLLEPGWIGPASWMNMAVEPSAPLYPTGLFELLSQRRSG